MVIKGLSCSYCGSELEALRIVEGVVHTHCEKCNTVSEPKAISPSTSIPAPPQSERERRWSNRSKSGQVEIVHRPRVRTLHQPIRSSQEENTATDIFSRR